jgi:hypothetical protein
MPRSPARPSDGTPHAASGQNPDLTAYRNQGWTAADAFVGSDRNYVVSGFQP